MSPVRYCNILWSMIYSSVRSSVHQVYGNGPLRVFKYSWSVLYICMYTMRARNKFTIHICCWKVGKMWYVKSESLIVNSHIFTYFANPLSTVHIVRRWCFHFRFTWFWRSTDILLMTNIAHIWLARSMKWTHLIGWSTRLASCLERLSSISFVVLILWV